MSKTIALEQFVREPIDRIRTVFALHGRQRFGRKTIDAMAKFRRKVLTVVRYLNPNAADRAYLESIRTSGLFDQDHYLRTYRQLNPLFRIWPERHYVQLGEGNGTSPNRDFSPHAYLFHNADLPPDTRPFLHYIQSGRVQGRRVIAMHPANVDLKYPKFTRPDRGQAHAPVAVSIHIYYPEFWEEIAPLLAAQKFDFDLFVTIARRTDVSPRAAERLRTRIKRRFANSQVWILPNHGRDILPFALLANSGIFAPYQAVLKLHSKKSPHLKDGDAWRRALVCGVLDDPDVTKARLKRFLAQSKAGIWVADGYLHEGDHWWGGNRPKAEALMARTDCLPLSGPLRFPAGSIYWARAEVLTMLTRLQLRPADFEPEQALVDGTSAHAVERLVGWLAQTSGYRLVPSRALDAE